MINVFFASLEFAEVCWSGVPFVLARVLGSRKQGREVTPIYPVVAERETHWGRRLKTQAMETGKSVVSVAPTP